MSTPVKPIQEFGATSQRALENFDEQYSAALVSMPAVWTSILGDVISGGSLKDTYPVALNALKYRLDAGKPTTFDTKVKEISIVKRTFSAGAEAEAKRIRLGDFAYSRTWSMTPAAMARARMFLHNRLVADALEANATCFDGVAFFSASHPVNAFDSSIKYHSSATWSNLQSVATPLTEANLTQEKAAFKMTPGPDGEELGLEPTHVLVPTSLDDKAYNMISVQDLITSGSTNTTGTVRNPHFKSGIVNVRAPELAGTDTTANWYLVSLTMPDIIPWILSEGDEELLTYDESSDYYKDTGRIKVVSKLDIEAALVHPHCIRKITGA